MFKVGMAIVKFADFSLPRLQTAEAEELGLVNLNLFKSIHFYLLSMISRGL
jgi:hypothetical protein